MTSQLAQWGDMSLVNDLAGQSAPFIQTATPGVPNSPNQLWITASSLAGLAVSQWQPNSAGLWSGGSWVALSVVSNQPVIPLYLALLTQDPVAAGATTISNLTELFGGPGSFGYSRQAVTFSAANAAYPSSSSNTGLITWGPITTSMTAPVQWVALVTVPTGTSGSLLATWFLSTGIQVNASQSIYCGINQLIIQGQ
jgi:hypothetical protein